VSDCWLPCTVGLPLVIMVSDDVRLQDINMLFTMRHPIRRTRIPLVQYVLLTAMLFLPTLMSCLMFSLLGLNHSPTKTSSLHPDLQLPTSRLTLLADSSTLRRMYSVAHTSYDHSRLQDGWNTEAMGGWGSIGAQLLFLCCAALPHD
jgi:hypothetical protein